MLYGKKILLGVTGSIAAYKAAVLVRLLVKQGAQVRVVMTDYAKEFITPLTLATLSNNPVANQFANRSDGTWHSHVEMGLWADVMLIAPATANSMAKMAYGIADNLLLTTYLSAKCPVIVAPAMDLDMFKHVATQQNIQKLSEQGVLFIDAQSGELASGLHGKGRLQEPEQIVEFLVHFFQKQNSLAGKKVLITAGPTYEKIDPVRFIGNHSTGKMGYALAEEMALNGAEVTLISGPTALSLTNPGIKRINVFSANQMFEHALNLFENTDIAIMSAAVADYTPAETFDQKVKRTSDNLIINLKPTTDIAAELGKRKNNKQLLLGFALETNDEKNNALKKIRKKNLDAIVLNSLNDSGAGFGHDTNKITIIDNNGSEINFELKTKKDVAKDIVAYIVSVFNTE